MGGGAPRGGAQLLGGDQQAGRVAPPRRGLGVWLDGAFWFSTGGRSRKARNLAADPRCAVSPQDAGESVVLERTAERVTDPEQVSRVLVVYTGKYGSGYPDPDANPLFAVRPRVVVGLMEQDPGLSASATRWTFGT